jgi:hypothetical protein
MNYPEGMPVHQWLVTIIGSFATFFSRLRYIVGHTELKQLSWHDNVSFFLTRFYDTPMQLDAMPLSFYVLINE